MKKVWRTPQVRTITAGSAENGTTQATKDGKNTRS